jgi:histidinol-phosphate aminotransferase
VLIETGVDSNILFEKLCQRGVIVRPGGGYGLPLTIRVTFGTPEQNRAFFSALEGALREMGRDRA